MHIISIGNQIISSAIWTKKARVNFFTSAYLFQIAREKLFDYLLIII